MSPAEPRGSRDQLMEPTEPCHVDWLPAELLQLVLSQLQLRRLLQVQRVSRRWRDAVLDLLRRRKELDLSYGHEEYEYDDDVLRRLLPLMPGLRVLRVFSGSFGDSDETLDIIASHCKHLVNIELIDIAVTSDSVRKLCVACPLLEVVMSDKLNESSLRVLLRHSPALRELDLTGSDVTGQCFSLLPGSLQRLSVRYCYYFRSDSLRQVGARCPQLRQLDVSGWDGLDAGDLVVVLAGCPQLRQLNVSRMQQSSADDLAAALSRCPQLERLTACYLRQPLERCLPPAGLPALTRLDVTRASGVTDTSLRRLPDLLPSLRMLEIAHCSAVTEEGLRHLRRSEQLLYVGLIGLSCVTDAGLDQLHGMQLKELSLVNSGYADVDITDEGVTRLVVACPSLTRLHLRLTGKLTPNVVSLLLRALPGSRVFTLIVVGARGEQRRQLLSLPSSATLRLVFEYRVVHK